MLRRQSKGFTIVELLIVIVVIAVLAAISVVAYNGIQQRARDSSVSNDLVMLDKAIRLARINTGNDLLTITGSGHSGGTCFTAENTYPGDLATSHGCWTRYNTVLDRIASASEMNLDTLRDGDPWGAPYYFDENEGENYASQGLCRSDVIGSFTNPLPSSRDGYNLANGGTTGYNWLRSYKLIRAKGPGC